MVLTLELHNWKTIAKYISSCSRITIESHSLTNCSSTMKLDFTVNTFSIVICTYNINMHASIQRLQAHLNLGSVLFSKCKQFSRAYSKNRRDTESYSSYCSRSFWTNPT